MKEYYKYYSYSEITQESTDNLISIISDGDIPQETKNLALLELGQRNVDINSINPES